MKNKNKEKSKPTKDKSKHPLAMKTPSKESTEFKELMKNSLKRQNFNFKNRSLETAPKRKWTC